MELALHGNYGVSEVNAPNCVFLVRNQRVKAGKGVGVKNTKVDISVRGNSEISKN